MYRKLEDFFEAYDGLSKGTLGLLEILGDEHLNRSILDGYRTLGQLGWHIVVTVPEMMSLTGLSLCAVDPHSPPPSKAEEIVKGYGGVSDELVEAIKGAWTDESLLELDDMYGEKWTKGKTLFVLSCHEIHHRAQMTVLMRQAGLAVPGLFGPSKEEWTQYGMETPSY
ncbi:MAG: DinB family protein [Rhodothermia bacterium]|nr:MAG: DinB family protein [Rhodothermia bacterium]